MPYIKEDNRQVLDDRVANAKNVDGLVADNAGELNYLFTCIANNYMRFVENYQRYNDVIGALEGAKLELYRRRIAFYEDTKILENGDV